MKKIIFIIIILLFSSPHILLGQESSQVVSSYPINIAVVGAANYDDVRFVLNNLKRSSQISQLVISTSSRGYVELSGIYNASKETLVEEISNLVQDRFSTEVIKQKGRQTSNNLSVTLRKLASSAQSN